MAQHITTIQEIRERTVAQEQQISDDDLLPFDHGTGSKRQGYSRVLVFLGG